MRDREVACACARFNFERRDTDKWNLEPLMNISTSSQTGRALRWSSRLSPWKTIMSWAGRRCGNRN